MIIIDTALKKRAAQDNPVKIAMTGAGFMGRGIALQIERYMQGVRLVAIANRTVSKARAAYEAAGVGEVHTVGTVSQMEDAVASGRYAVTDNPDLICEADGIDVIIEATGHVEYSARIALKAIEHRKHIVLMNAELDATVGPMLKVYADRAGIVITNADGDQPGVMMNLYRFVETIGYKPLMAGNIKGLQDYYRTPETQKRFAAENGISPVMATSFADGTKISMENTVVANATGFRVGRRGMFGPRCAKVSEAVDLFPTDQMMNGGLVDYILGAEPGPGVFVIGYNDQPDRRNYMRYYKMGDGPFYTFYVPYHLPHLEVPLTAARAVIFNDAAVTPAGAPVCDVITIAKRDLRAGEILDGIGGFTCYGMIENAPLSRELQLLPMGLCEGCRLTKGIPKDHPICIGDVQRPPGRQCDALREAQDTYFA